MEAFRFAAYSAENDPGRQMIPKMDSKWSLTANGPHCRPQKNPWKTWKIEKWKGTENLNTV